MSLPLTHAGLSAPGISAALDLKFASTLSLTSSSGITPSFSRASTGTYFNSSGVLTSAAINAPRFDFTYNGTSWISRGLLVEEQRTNLITQSNAFTGSAWAIRTGVTVTSNNATSPDGTSNATTINEGTANDYHDIYNTGTIAGSSGTFTYSIFAKNVNGQYLNLAVSFNSSNYIGIIFDLSNGTVANSASVGGFSIVSSSITNVGNGWYRCAVIVTTNSTCGINVSLANSTTIGTYGVSTYTGTSRSIQIYGAQFESGSFSTSYIPTSGSSTTRSADVCQITGTNFSSFWNASEGSCIVEYDRLAPIGPATPGYVYPRTFCFYGGAGNSIDLFGNHGSSPPSELLASTSSGSSQFGFSANTYNNTANGTQVIGFATKLNDSSFSYNGDAVLTDTSCVVPSINSLYIGSLAPSGNILNGHIARLRYFNKRLTDKQLEDLCRPEDQLKLDLKFSENLSLTPVVGPTPSFSRASTGSYFDSTGTLRYANVNLLLNSESFNTSPYWTAAAGTTITANQTVAPNGSLTAENISGVNGFYQNSSGVGSSIVTNTGSIYAKANGSSEIKLRINEFGSGVNYVEGTFNLLTGISTASNGGSGSGATASMVNVGNGWWRCIITGKPSTTAATCGFYPYGMTTSVYCWGAQFEAASSAGQYAKTEASTSAGPRFDHTYDGTSWISKGLLIEEQRTNTALYSSDIGNAYWGGTSSKTANFGISPDGTQNAARITGGGYFQSGGISKLGAQTFSFWAKTISGNSESINAFLDGGATTTTLTITGSWVRYSVTQTFGSTNTGTIGIYPLSASILFYGPQLELGAFPTSYIPTTTTSVVRSADVCQITGTDFSGFWNSTQGSFASEWDAQRNSTGQFTIYWVRDSADNNIVVHSGREALTPPGVRFSVASGGASSAEIISSGFPAVGATTRTAGAYKANDFAYAYSGSLVGTDTSGAVPVSPTEIRIGYDPYNNWLNGHISRLRYYAIRLPNRLLIAKSQ